jgi:hypothetical protein
MRLRGRTHPVAEAQPRQLHAPAVASMFLRRYPRRRRRHRDRPGARAETRRGDGHGGGHCSRPRSGDRGRPLHRGRSNPCGAAHDHEAGKPNPRPVRIDRVVHDQGYEPIGRGRAPCLGLRPVADRPDPHLGRDGPWDTGVLDGQLTTIPRQPQVRAPSSSRGAPYSRRYKSRVGHCARRRHAERSSHGRDHQSGAELHGLT